MLQLKRLTETFAVSTALCTPEDFALARALGFTTLISFLPDGELDAALSSAATGRTAERAGLRFVHIPAQKYDLFTSEIVEALRVALAGAEGPVLATCASGQRAAIVWAAAQARDGLCVDRILERLEQAGFELGFLRDDLEAQTHKQHWLPAQAPLTTAKRAAA